MLCFSDISVSLFSGTMTDTTDDIAEEISFQSFDDDCKLLGNLLNDVLQREVGGKFMEKLERNRILAQVGFFIFDFGGWVYGGCSLIICERSDCAILFTPPMNIVPVGDNMHHFSAFYFSFFYVLLSVWILRKMRRENNKTKFSLGCLAF